MVAGLMVTSYATPHTAEKKNKTGQHLATLASSVEHGGAMPGGWGYSHVKAYGDVPPKWVTFSPKILRHGSHFGQKNP